MAGSAPKSSTSQQLRAVTSDSRLITGTLLGTPILGSVEYFLEKYGPAAGGNIVASLPQWRDFVRPNAPALGLLSARRYPYAFLSDVVKAMVKTARVGDEDAFIREIAAAGIDRAMSTTMRTMLRIATPQQLAASGQASWSSFHDTGRVEATSVGKEYYVRTTEWHRHEVIVCKISMEVRRRILERMGLRNVTARRERCLGWGHDDCVVRLRWD